MKNFMSILGGLPLGINLLVAADYSVKSPDGKISATVSAENGGLYFSVSADGKVLLDRAGIGMDTSAGQFGAGAQAKKPEYKRVSQTLENALGTKRKIADNYNEMLVDFGKFSILVRAYDEAAAYRFQSQADGGELTVKGEKLDLPLAGDTKVIATYTKGVVSSFESPYTRTTPDGMKKAGANVASSMPFIFEKAGMKVALVESDVFDYPALRIACREGDKVPHAVFSSLPKTLVQRGNKLVAGETFDCIAKTSAKRQFPWRAFIAARRDIDLADNDTAYKLATASKIGDSSWIKAGNSTWDWWVNWNTEGVDFKCGFNEDMCKYYIDFACANDIPYITLDAGWHIGRGQLGENSYYLINSEEKSAFMEQYNKDENYVNGKPYVDIPSVVKYAHARGKKVLIWSLSKVLYAYPEKALDLFKSWGVDGLKIDFNDRDDQLMMRHLENITRLAAERQMLIEWRYAQLQPAQLCDCKGHSESSGNARAYGCAIRPVLQPPPDDFRYAQHLYARGQAARVHRPDPERLGRDQGNRGRNRQIHRNRAPQRRQMVHRRNVRLGREGSRNRPLENPARGRKISGENRARHGELQRHSRGL